MPKLFVVYIFCFFLAEPIASARTYTAQEAQIAWAYWKRQPLNQENFHAVCDLLQDIAQTDIPVSYEILREYTPMIVHTGNKAWVHILLMGWAKAKESLADFPETYNRNGGSRAQETKSNKFCQSYFC